MNNTLEIKDLRTYFPIRAGLFRRTLGCVKAVDGVSFSIVKGQTLGLVGESGCGKSTLARSILRLIEPAAGEILLEGRNILALPPNQSKQWCRDIQIVWQDPLGSLNPRMTVGETLMEPLKIHHIGGGTSERLKRARELLELVGLSGNMTSRYPHEFSGGQRQRIGIARALALNPGFVVLDEPVAALDVSVQSQILNLITDLQRTLGVGILFISHDLTVVQHVSHRVAVMYLGKIVEIGSVKSLYTDARHPYTRMLLAAVPTGEFGKSQVNAGDLPVTSKVSSTNAAGAGGVALSAPDVPLSGTIVGKLNTASAL